MGIACLVLLVLLVVALRRSGKVSDEVTFLRKEAAWLSEELQQEQLRVHEILTELAWTELQLEKHRTDLERGFQQGESRRLLKQERKEQASREAYIREGPIPF